MRGHLVSAIVRRPLFRRGALFEPMRIDFLIPVFGVPELDFLLPLVDGLRSQGHSAAFLAVSEGMVAALQDRGFEAFFVYDGLDRRSEVSPSEIREFECRYKLGSMRGFVFTEHVYEWGKRYPDLLRRAVHLFRYMERLFSEHSIGRLLNNMGVEVLRRVAARVGATRGVPNTMFDFTVLTGRFALVPDELGLRLPAIPPTLPRADIEYAQEFLSWARRARQPYAPVSTLGFGVANFRGAISAIASIRDQRDLSVRKLIVERARRVGRRLVAPIMYETPRSEEDYFFFPLHIANDSAITVRAPQYQRQDEFVQYVAERALPAGVKLYVKPHIAAQDGFALNTLAKIKQLPNVRLISPTLNPHSLIEGAMVNIVINSTAGFEGILHRRPVVVVGAPFYARHGLTVDVENMRDLPSAVDSALSFVPTEERIIRFIAHLRRHTREGVYGDPNPANVAKIVAAVVEYSSQVPHGERHEYLTPGRS